MAEEDVRARPDLPAHHPLNVPLSDWTDGWLKMEVASLLDDPIFIFMDDFERRKCGLPCGRNDMIRFIESRQKPAGRRALQGSPNHD